MYPNNSRQTTEYTLSIENIKQYLSSLAPNAAVGVPGSLHSCLAANALCYKYSKPFSTGYTTFDPMDGTYNEFSPDVTEVIVQFCRLDRAFPTREEVEQAIPVLKGDKN